MSAKTDLSANSDGSITLYVGGKKVLKGTLSQIVEHLSGQSAPAPKPKKVKPKSRSARWGDAASAAVAALEELQEIKGEFEEWRDNLPENLQQSTIGEKLEFVCDLDIDSALETVQEAENADLPLGFGRD